MKRLARDRGVSLLEALVAMAVMAIGAVSVVGLQSTLRLNGDVAKQRAVAVRLAQEVIERGRGFSTLTPTSTAGVVDWSDLTSMSETLTPVDVNAEFTRTVTVVARGEGDDNPRSKSVHVQVTWTDRANQLQTVEMNSIVSGVDPQLGGSLSMSMEKSPVRSAGGRNPAIPRSAIEQPNGTSHFTPPGVDSPTWVFNNTTGLVTQVCTSAGVCSDATGMLLSGFVRFSTGPSQPTGVEAENPTSPALPVAVTVDQQVPSLGPISCFLGFDSTFVSYYCLLLVTEAFPTWTGQVELSGIPLASAMASSDPARYKVCRYTAVRSNTAVVPTDLKNEQTPLRYVGVNKPLTGQNFLVIKAGDGSAAFTCPDDNAGTPKVNGATWNHQPAT